MDGVIWNAPVLSHVIWNSARNSLSSVRLTGIPFSFLFSFSRVSRATCVPVAHLPVFFLTGMRTTRCSAYVCQLLGERDVVRFCGCVFICFLHGSRAHAPVMKWLNNISVFLVMDDTVESRRWSGERIARSQTTGGRRGWQWRWGQPRASEQQQQDTTAQLVQKRWCPAIGDVATTGVCQRGGRRTVTAFSVSVGHIAFRIAQRLDQFRSGGAGCRSSRCDG